MVEALDPFALNSIFQSTVASKSAALALALIWKDGSGLTLPPDQRITLQEAVNIALLDEKYQ